MKKLVYQWLLLSIISLYSCSSTNNGIGEIMNFDYTYNDRSFIDSTFLSNMKIIELRRAEESFLRHIDRMFLINGEYYIMDKSQDAVFVYNSQGDYLRSICKLGRGHGEYLQLVDVAYDKHTDEFLFLVAPSAIYRYSRDGAFVGKSDLNHLYAEIAVDSAYVYLYNPTYTQNREMSYTIECQNKNMKERNIQLLDEGTDFSPYASFGYRMFTGQDDILFVRKFDSHIYKMKNGEIVQSYQINLGQHEFHHSEEEQLSSIELTEYCWQNKMVYVFSSIASSNHYLLFSTNLWNINICNLNDGVCDGFSRISIPAYGINLLSFTPIEGSSKICFYLEAERILQTKELFARTPESKSRSSKAFVELAERYSGGDNPVLFIYDIQ